MIQFEVGKTYATRSIVDSDSWFSITIKSRTAKTIKTECGKTLRCAIYEGKEQVKPFGSYSMCAIIDASDLKEAPRDGLKELLRSTPEYLEIPEAPDLSELAETAKTRFTLPNNVVSLSAYRKKLAH